MNNYEICDDYPSQNVENLALGAIALARQVKALKDQEDYHEAFFQDLANQDGGPDLLEKFLSLRSLNETEVEGVILAIDTLLDAFVEDTNKSSNDTIPSSTEKSSVEKSGYEFKRNSFMNRRSEMISIDSEGNFIIQLSTFDDVEVSRIQDFNDLILNGKKPNEYNLVSNGKKYDWNGLTWIDDSGKRLKIYGEPLKISLIKKPDSEESPAESYVENELTENDEDTDLKDSVVAQETASEIDTDADADSQSSVSANEMAPEIAEDQEEIVYLNRAKTQKIYEDMHKLPPSIVDKIINIDGNKYIQKANENGYVINRYVQLPESDDWYEIPYIPSVEEAYAPTYESFETKNVDMSVSALRKIKKDADDWAWRNRHNGVKNLPLRKLPNNPENQESLTH